MKITFSPLICLFPLYWWKAVRLFGSKGDRTPILTVGIQLQWTRQLHSRIILQQTTMAPTYPSLQHGTPKISPNPYSPFTRTFGVWKGNIAPSWRDSWRGKSPLVKMHSMEDNSPKMGVLTGQFLCHSPAALPPTPSPTQRKPKGNSKDLCWYCLVCCLVCQQARPRPILCLQNMTNWGGGVIWVLLLPYCYSPQQESNGKALCWLYSTAAVVRPCLAQIFYTLATYLFSYHLSIPLFSPGGNLSSYVFLLPVTL